MSRDMRAYRRQTTFRLIVGGIAIIFLIGDGLVAVLYGWDAALMGFLCLVIGLSPLVLIAILLWVMDVIGRQMTNRE